MSTPKVTIEKTTSIHFTLDKFQFLWTSINISASFSCWQMLLNKQSLIDILYQISVNNKFNACNIFLQLEFPFYTFKLHRESLTTTLDACFVKDDTIIDCRQNCNFHKRNNVIGFLCM